MSYSYSLHKIYEEGQFGFDPMEYSRFKFGDDEVAGRFGTALAKGFISQILSKSAMDRPIVVVSSPYAFIPTATFYMKNYFVFEINHWLANQRKPVVEETKIYRTVTYKEDYGQMNAEQRYNLICNDKFYMDATFVRGKLLLFLDDIKITGSHERMIHKMLADNGIEEDHYMIYFAELINENIDPVIENTLNYSYVKTLSDLNAIIYESQFKFNTRVVKYILISDSHDFEEFISNKEINFLNLLYHNAIGNGYHEIPEYAVNLGILSECIKTSQFINNYID